MKLAKLRKGRNLLKSTNSRVVWVDFEVEVYVWEGDGLDLKV